MGPNHTMINKDSLKRKCGFYIKYRINYKPRTDLDIAYYDDNKFQCSLVEITNQANPNILVGTYYRHPKKNSDNPWEIERKVI